jgi:hypothetical protein
MRNINPPKREEYADFVFSETEEDEGFPKRALLTDEAVFHINRHTNRPNCRIWQAELTYEFSAHVHRTVQL